MITLYYGTFKQVEILGQRYMSTEIVENSETFEDVGDMESFLNDYIASDGIPLDTVYFEDENGNIHELAKLRFQ